MTDELVTMVEKFGSLSEYYIRLNRWILKPIGAWPTSSSATRKEKIVTQIVIIICWCILLFTMISGLLHMILEKEDIYIKLKAIGPVIFWCTGTFNYVILLLHKDDICFCIEHVRADWKIITRVKDQRVMFKAAKLGRYIASICAEFTFGAILGFCIISGTFKQTMKVRNETIITYSLPCPVYKLPIHTNPTHSIIFTTQFLSAIILSANASGFFTLVATLTSHAFGQLNVMMTWISEFVNQTSNHNKNTNINVIGVIVEHHSRILSLISRIERMMNQIYLLEMFKSMLGMCLPCYLILAEWSEHNIPNTVKYTIIFISMTFNIFLLCYTGEILTKQCKKVGDVIYMTNWYQLPDKDILNLMMIILRSGTEVKLTSGKLITMSVLTFGNVLKTVFAYLNMLRQVICFISPSEYRIQLDRWILKPIAAWPALSSSMTIRRMAYEYEYEEI
ncbi:PREDICTED: odorant receptor 22c-like [Eufriesea mexicana]|uniref:odorant receptor 22c-like n=1 Tax=Eufriesea mexicana TaxID=516756 RepID=UPI00083C1099|nr:PREDICTED: odorant receptor 22c-like [Eufriesea mexicana]